MFSCIVNTASDVGTSCSILWHTVLALIIILHVTPNPKGLLENVWASFAEVWLLEAQVIFWSPSKFQKSEGIRIDTFYSIILFLSVVVYDCR